MWRGAAGAQRTCIPSCCAGIDCIATSEVHLIGVESCRGPNDVCKTIPCARRQPSLSRADTGFHIKAARKNI